MANFSRVVLVKHALPVLDPSRPAREWRLGEEGRSQSRLLAERLRQFSPIRLIASPEPKAQETAQIVAEQLDTPLEIVDGLQELDRRALPIMSRREHERVNEPIFEDFDRPILGSESARVALDRFSAALHSELEVAPEQSLVVVTHGTVIALFTGAHNDTSEFELWKRLRCPAMVVLERQSFAVVEIVDGL